MVITFTLQPKYSGATYVAGPFNISGTTNTGVTTVLASNVSKSTLLAGLVITGINDNTIGGTIQSIGTCNNSISWLVGGTTSTPTPTPTPTGRSSCSRWTMTYNPSTTILTGLSVRYSVCGPGYVVTKGFNQLFTYDNMDGTYTAVVCTDDAAVTTQPICIQNYNPVACPGPGWVYEGPCDL